MPLNLKRLYDSDKSRLPRETPQLQEDAIRHHPLKPLDLGGVQGVSASVAWVYYKTKG